MITYHITGCDYGYTQEDSKFEHVEISEVIPDTRSANHAMDSQTRETVISMLQRGLTEIAVTGEDSHDGSYFNPMPHILSGCRIPVSMLSQLSSVK